MGSDFPYKAAEFVYWVAGATAAVVAVSTVVGLLVGGDLVAVKLALFVVGFLLFGVGSLAIQPRSPASQLQDLSTESDEPVEDSESILLGGGGSRRRVGRRQRVKGMVESEDEHWFEAAIQGLPPLRGRPLPYERRVRRSTKVFVTSLVVLGVSMAMEFVFDVRI